MISMNHHDRREISNGFLRLRAISPIGIVIGFYLNNTVIIEETTISRGSLGTK